MEKDLLDKLYDKIMRGEKLTERETIVWHIYCFVYLCDKVC